MILPTIHRNGTDKEALLDQVSAAHNSLLDAMGVIGKAIPDARDYYRRVTTRSNRPRKNTAIDKTECTPWPTNTSNCTKRSTHSNLSEIR